MAIVLAGCFGRGVAFFAAGAGAAGFAAVLGAAFTLFAGFSAGALLETDFFAGAAGARPGLLAALFAAAVLFFALVTTCRLPLLGVGPGVRVLP
ncbi:hypothetical protein [Sandaracinus amylolyticus]|uniref:hypothetical protein n=1 Tax=Sandaracinus amylolyticus TaxID=927083 RepID=UPI0012EDABBB|nr:hypothetical protein [Sandaracinus amylolyticus]